jgi:tetratricopeptide (TPR) repeat protein
MKCHSTIGRRAALALLLAACACAQTPKRAHLTAAESYERAGQPGAPPAGLPPAAEALTRGRQAEADGRWDEAQAAYSEALLRDPSSVEAAVSQARVLHVLGLHAEATLVLHSAIEAHPDSVELLAAAGDSVLHHEPPVDGLRVLLDGPRPAARRRGAARRVRLGAAPAGPARVGDRDAAHRRPEPAPRLRAPRAGPLGAAVRQGRAGRVQPRGLGARRARRRAARLDLARARYLAGEDGLVLQSLEAVIARQPRSAEAFALLGTCASARASRSSRWPPTSRPSGSAPTPRRSSRSSTAPAARSTS